MVHVALLRLQRLFLPPTCLLCAGMGQDLDFDICAACSADLPAHGHACVRCGEFLTNKNSAIDICGACLKRPPRYDAIHCAFSYGYPIDHLIRALKYHGRLAHGRVLGRLLAHSLQASSPSWPEWIVPVPLASSRYSERGFNQAFEIAKQLQHVLRIPIHTDVLERIRDTREQAGLDRIGRRKNVRGAFKLRDSVPGLHVAIVDDVVTTGSTVNEVARVLKRAGARRVDVWAVARASKSF